MPYCTVRIGASIKEGTKHLAWRSEEGVGKVDQGSGRAVRLRNSKLGTVHLACWKKRSSGELFLHSWAHFSAVGIPKSIMAGSPGCTVAILCPVRSAPHAGHPELAPAAAAHSRASARGSTRLAMLEVGW